MLAMWMYFWTEADWVPPAVQAFWCALTGMSGMTGGGDIDLNLG